MNIKKLLIPLVLSVFLLSGCKNAPSPDLQEPVSEHTESPRAQQETRASISIVPDESSVPESLELVEGSAIQFVDPSSP